MITQTRKFLRIHEVCERIGFKQDWIYKLIKRNQFPAPKKIGVRANAWLESDIERWIESKIQNPASQKEVGYSSQGKGAR